MRDTDFIVIGTQKCGSNSINRYLSPHPEIFLPTQVATTFFAHDPYYERGLEWYRQEWFAEARADQVTGEISVPYLLYTKSAERIAAAYPNVKLIVLARDPVERAYSHYQMALRWQAEENSFADCVDRLLRRGRVGDDDLEVTEKDNQEYVQTGEYGASLEPWFKLFPSSSIRVLFFEEFFASPEQTTREIFEWLGVAPDFRPACLGHQFHAGGACRFPRFSRWTFGAIQRLKRNPITSSIYYDYIPKNARHKYRQLRSWFDKEFNVKAATPTVMDARSREKLIDHYRKDVKILEAMIGRPVPWPELTGHCSRRTAA